MPKATRLPRGSTIPAAWQPQIAAYAAMRGVLAPGRLTLETLTRADFGALGVPEMLAGTFAIRADQMRWIIALGSAGGLCRTCFASPAFRSSPRNIVAGLAIGFLVTAGWYRQFPDCAGRRRDPRFLCCGAGARPSGHFGFKVSLAIRGSRRLSKVAAPRMFRTELGTSSALLRPDRLVLKPCRPQKK